MSDASAKISTGTDWLTVTEVTGAGVDDLAQIAFEIKQAHIPKNAISKPWKAQGYTGTSVGELAFGTRGESEGILRISGELARTAYPGIPINWARVTRIDLQVTVALKERDDRVALRKYQELRNLTKSGESGTIYKLISSNTGDTLYLGKRTHSRLLRFYDKSLDYGMKETGWAWRYEVEYKKGTAKNIAKTVAYMNDPYVDIGNLIWQEYANKGFHPAFKSTGSITAMEVGTTYKTPEGQVRWLEKCVAPVVTQLINLGYEDQILHALRLRDIKKD